MSSISLSNSQTAVPRLLGICKSLSGGPQGKNIYIKQYQDVVCLFWCVNIGSDHAIPGKTAGILTQKEAVPAVASTVLVVIVFFTVMYLQ